MAKCMNIPKQPCAECPWRVDVARGQFPASRYEALRHTTGERGREASMGSPLFACHKSNDGTDMPCAGWLASVGWESITVRLLVIHGRIPGEALKPGDDWPALHSSYEEMAKAKAGA